ncbi:MAG TPA: biotin/lipoyl-binding protein [Pseudothermotoga sp.]|nr:biotin/lipoyl-binding protein [Pseudothermotoga sp.]HOK83222.1 biotin/lipoyl-binding protein [Pseudothermotoga sp.]HPP71021.1 biotin/lipoyl-binding protein [Pseudothermotoga sp.]
MARKFRVVVSGKEYIVEVEELGSSTTAQVLQPVNVPVEKPVEKQIEKPRPEQPKIVEEPKQPAPKPSAPAGGIEIRSPMSGLILKIHVSEGQQVSRGQKLLVLEAMKMENDILSEHDGKVAKILVKEGDTVETQQTLLIIQ